MERCALGAIKQWGNAQDAVATAQRRGYWARDMADFLHGRVLGEGNTQHGD